MRELKITVKEGFPLSSKDYELTIDEFNDKITRFFVYLVYSKYQIRWKKFINLGCNWERCLKPKKFKIIEFIKLLHNNHLQIKGMLSIEENKNYLLGRYGDSNINFKITKNISGEDLCEIKIISRYGYYGYIRFLYE